MSSSNNNESSILTSDEKKKFRDSFANQVCYAQTGVYSCLESDSIDKVVRLLADKKIISLPVWCAKETTLLGKSTKIVGLVDIHSIMEFVAVRQFDKSKGKKEARNSLRKSLSQDITVSNCFEESIGKVLEQKKKSTTYDPQKVYLFSGMSRVSQILDDVFSEDLNCHRVFIDLPKIVSVNPDQRKLGIISKSDLIKFLYVNLDDFLPEKISKNTTLSKLNVISYEKKDVLSIDKKKVTIKAFSKMTKHNLDALAVVDKSNDNQMLANISPSDLRGLTKNTIDQLLEPIETFINIDKSTTVFSATPEDTLQQTLKTLVDNKIHRIWVLDENKHPIGFVSHSAILQLFKK